VCALCAVKFGVFVEVSVCCIWESFFSGFLGVNWCSL